jgi:hypothetical protein
MAEKRFSPTQAEWDAKGTELFGPDKERWRFVCWACGNVMSIERARAEFPALKGRGWAPHQECIGRYIDVPEAQVKGQGRITSKRCAWCAYGLIRGPVVVRMPDGEEIGVFDFEGLPFTAKEQRHA